MTAHRLPDDACPFCGHVCNAASTLDGDTAPPEEGDASVCLECGSLVIYGPGLRLRRPTRRQTRELCAYPEVAAVLKAVGDFKRTPRV